MRFIIEFLKRFAPMLRSGKMSYGDALRRFKAQYGKAAEGMEKAAIMKEVEKAPSNVIQFPSGGVHNVPVDQQFTPPGSREIFEVLDDDAYQALKGDYYRRLLTNTDDDVKAFAKRVIANKQDVKLERLTKDQRKDMLTMIDDRIKMGNRKFMNEYDSKFPVDEDFASGGIARVGMFMCGPVWKKFIEKLFIKASNQIRQGKGKWAGLTQEQWIKQHDDLTKMLKKWEGGGKKGLPEGAEQYIGMNDLQITRAIKEATKKVKKTGPLVSDDVLAKAYDEVFYQKPASGDYKYDADVLSDSIAEQLGKGSLDDFSQVQQTEIYNTALKRVTDDLKMKRTLKDVEQKMQLSDFDPKDRKPNASGGIAGELHLNRQGFPFGGQALKAIREAWRANKTWGVGGPPYKPGATSFDVKDITERLYGTEMSLADIRKMSKDPIMSGVNKFDFEKFNKTWKDLKAGVLREKMMERKLEAEAMINAAEKTMKDAIEEGGNVAMAKRITDQMKRESKNALEEVTEGLKEIEIYKGMLQKKGRKLHASGGLAHVLGV